MARAPDLERRVLERLWQGGALTVREVLEQVGQDLAYTTIATVLDRLHGKGQVERIKDGVAWRYRAAASREQAVGAAVARLLDRAQGAGEPLWMAFLDQVERTDPAALDHLEALLRARRGER